MKTSTLASILCILLLVSCRKTEPIKTDTGQPVVAGHPGHVDMSRTPDYRGLIEEYRTVLADDPKNLAALVALGNVYYDLGQWKASAMMYEHALALDPRNADVHTDRGTALRNLGSPDQALSEYRRAIELEPGHLDARYNLGVVLAYDKKDGRAAVQAWEELLKLAPNYRNAQIIREHITVINHQSHRDVR